MIENVTVHDSAVVDMGDKYTFNIVLFSFEPSGAKTKGGVLKFELLEFTENVRNKNVSSKLIVFDEN